MTRDLIELLQPHIDDSDSERNIQEMEKRKRQDKAREEREEERKKMKGLLKEIEKDVAAVKKVLQNSCIVTITTKIKDGTRMGIMSVDLEKKGEEIVITAFPGANGLSLKSGESVERLLRVAMNQKTNLEKELRDAFGELAYPLYIESLYGILSVDDVRVTYK